MIPATAIGFRLQDRHTVHPVRRWGNSRLTPCSRFRYCPPLTGTRGHSLPAGRASYHYPSSSKSCTTTCKSANLAGDPRPRRKSPPGCSERAWLRAPGDLIVQTADGALAGAEAHIGLQGGEVDCVLCEFTLAPRAHESTSSVFMGGRLDDPRAEDITFVENHFMQPVRPLSDTENRVLECETGSSFTIPLSRSS